MSFLDDITRFSAKVQRRHDAVVGGAVDETFRSITDGSTITGAPGQPIGSGELYDSWTKERPSVNEGVVKTNHPAAPAVENNWSGVQFHNHGPHSVKLTVAAWPRIVEHVTKQVVKS